MDRIQLEMRVAAFFFYYDYGIKDFEYNGVTYELSPAYLEGKLMDDNEENKIILLSDEHKSMLNDIYYKRVIPIFGEYNEDGKKVKDGMVEVIVDEGMSNPTGIRNYLFKYAKENGEILYEDYITEENGIKKKYQRISGYKPNDPDKYTIITIDHLRALKRERGYNLKQNIDKFSEYQRWLRNNFFFTFVDIIHLNRAIGNWERIKFYGDKLYPTGNDVKDTGNLSEDCDYMITLFNPKDELYNLKSHFGLNLSNYPHYRSIHLVEARGTKCPVHFKTNFYGNIGWFESI